MLILGNASPRIGLSGAGFRAGNGFKPIEVVMIFEEPIFDDVDVLDPNEPVQDGSSFDATPVIVSFLEDSAGRKMGRFDT
jgi:hypothetical protein